MNLFLNESTHSDVKWHETSVTIPFALKSYSKQQCQLHIWGYGCLNCYCFTAYSLEGMRSIAEADKCRSFVKEAYREREGHNAQTEVGQDRDGTELEQTSQTHNQTSKHQPGGPHISPV